MKLEAKMQHMQALENSLMESTRATTGLQEIITSIVNDEKKRRERLEKPDPPTRPEAIEDVRVALADLIDRVTYLEKHL